MMVSNSGVTVSKNKSIKFQWIFSSRQNTYQAVHRSRGHNLQQRTGCCWGTWVQSGLKRITQSIKLSFIEERKTAKHNKPPPLPHCQDCRGPEVRASMGSICGVFVALNSCGQFQIAPILKWERTLKMWILTIFVGMCMRTIIFAQMASCF